MRARRRELLVAACDQSASRRTDARARLPGAAAAAPRCGCCRAAAARRDRRAHARIRAGPASRRVRRPPRAAAARRLVRPRPDRARAARCRPCAVRPSLARARAPRAPALAPRPSRPSRCSASAACERHGTKAGLWISSDSAELPDLAGSRRAPAPAPDWSRESTPRVDGTGCGDHPARSSSEVSAISCCGLVDLTALEQHLGEEPRAVRERRREPARTVSARRTRGPPRRAAARRLRSARGLSRAGDTASGQPVPAPSARPRSRARSRALRLSTSPAIASAAQGARRGSCGPPSGAGRLRVPSPQIDRSLTRNAATGLLGSQPTTSMSPLPSPRSDSCLRRFTPLRRGDRVELGVEAGRR